MPKNILDSDSSSDENEETTKSEPLKINENYAKVFNQYREKEEYQRLKAKYGEEVANDKLNEIEDSSSSEEEDDEAEQWTEEHETDFLKALANLKGKKAKIYDGQTSFFSKPLEAKNEKNKADKPLTLVDLERQVILEKEGQFEDISDETLAQKHESKTYVQELEDIKDSIKGALKNSDDESDQEDLLNKKSKSAQEIAVEENEYKKWLLGQKEHLQDSNTENELKNLKEFWSDKNLDKDEKFLRDFILNKKYLEGNEEEVEIDEDLSEDEKTLEQQEEFEHKFNFRFEEPDQDFIKRYPRTIQDSMRRKDDSRKSKREATKERKDKEKEKKREELKQLKAFKRKEILDKIEQLRKITGNDELAFKDEDLEEDFDPEKYDQRMAEVFEQYDNAPFQPEDEEKPVFSDMDSDLEPDNWDEYGDEEDDQNNEDFDNEDETQESQSDNLKKEDAQQEIVESTKGRKKSKKKKSKFAEALEKEKPTFDPNDKASFEEYLDEYYGLDYEDIIGDLPCRFKYRKVPANDLGLSTEEILNAPDRELNSWASLKKTCQYRSNEDEDKDIKEYAKKKNNLSLKKKVLPSLFNEDPEENLAAEKTNKANKNRKRRSRKKASVPNINLDAFNETPKMKIHTEKTQNVGENENKKSKRKRKKNEGNNANAGGVGGKKAKIDINAELAISDSRLENYGLNPRQFKQKIRGQKFKTNKKS